MTVIAYDTEFLEDGATIDLISIGMARADGAWYYAVNSQANWAEIGKHRWLCENVIPSLPLAGKGITETQPNGRGTAKTWQFAVDTTDTRVKPKWVIANEVREFILDVDDPQLWADYGSYDHVALAQLWGTMMQLPAGIPMWTHDLRQELERAGNPQIPPPDGLTAHNALDDAREVLHRLTWLRERSA
jgi:3'-5' exoribonuclease Rv2179c-like domain